MVARRSAGSGKRCLSVASALATCLGLMLISNQAAADTRGSITQSRFDDDLTLDDLELVNSEPVVFEATEERSGTTVIVHGVRNAYIPKGAMTMACQYILQPAYPQKHTAGGIAYVWSAGTATVTAECQHGFTPTYYLQERVIEGYVTRDTQSYTVQPGRSQSFYVRGANCFAQDISVTWRAGFNGSGWLYRVQYCRT